MGKLRFQFKVFHKPLFGWKGSFVVTNVYFLILLLEVDTESGTVVSGLVAHKPEAWYYN